MTPQMRLIGLVALVALAVGIALIVVGVRERGAVAAPAPTVSVSPSPRGEPVKIPDVARTEIWRSPQTASGEFDKADLQMPSTVKTEKTNRFSVAVETSLNLDPNEVARTVHSILNDSRGWAGYGKNGFALVNDELANLRVVLAAPDTVDHMCDAKKTKGLDNCLAADTVVINSDRWNYMVPSFNNLDEYRAWAVNHQVGRWLGQRVGYCTQEGQLAPVMVDQATKLGDCLPNAWPKLVD